ncbi:transposase [Psychrobacillus sp.]|uniref:transposase n=1 Tax=Psychrobacillus sp. TaxID=1871623 RepID=UPI0028BE6B93|nr:transposase [Psychrobacillus sp.]
MTLCKVYVSLNHRQVYAFPDESTWEFEVTAERRIIRILHQLFDQLKRVEGAHFFSPDIQNSPYDLRLKKIYALIHEFCDEESKKFIEQLPYFQLRKVEQA